MKKTDSQNPASFEEQRLALRTIVHGVDRYTALVRGVQVLTHIKNVIVHGAPGTGKTFMGMMGVLYVLCQGLRCLSTSLMASRANSLGGRHIHKLFLLPSSKSGIVHPYRCAQEAMEKIKRNKLLHHILLTVDVIFFDEAGQISAQQLSMIEIILRKLRNSDVPYGGVLIIGTMDHTQTQPVNALPFLLSSHILTCYTMVQLKESVRAADDALFREFQHLTRENPYVLLNSPEKKDRFFELATNIFNYADTWNSPKIKKNMSLLFARKSKVKSATALYTDTLIANFTNNDNATPYRIIYSVDHQVRTGTAGDYTVAMSSTVASLNNNLREPARLVIFPGGVYEITINDPRGRYQQSNLAIIVDMPTDDTLDTFSPFPIWIAPPNTQRVDFLENSSVLPSKAQLQSWGWREIVVGVAPGRDVIARGGFHARRKQYSIKHVGALSIHKSQGLTICNGLAVECSANDSSPWEKEQVVVMFSRTKRSRDMVIVGEKIWVAKKLWKLITTANQWTMMMENILDMVTINSDDFRPDSATFQHAEHYPFLPSHAPIPSDNTGYVYLLTSCSNPHFSYIGQTTNLLQRVRQHQSGHGAIGTADPANRPFALAAYISGLGSYHTAMRMSLERQWRHYRNQLANDDVFNIIQQGERIVMDQNLTAEANGSTDRLNFVEMILPR